MGRLELQFSEDNSPQLLKVSFFHELLAEPICSVRGKTEGAYRGFASFQWTPAVRALALLLVRSASWQATDQKGPAPLLEGGPSSAATSLDYALRKQPQWMSEMFGWDAKGNPLLRRLVRRSNSDRRRSAPVAVSLQARFAAECRITISKGEQQISSAKDLAALAKALEVSWRPKKRPCPDDAPPQLSWSEHLREFHQQEITRSLGTRSIFNQSKLRDTVTALLDNPSFTNVAGSGAKLLQQLDTELYSANHFGIPDDQSLHQELLCDDEPIRCSIPCTLPTAIIIFEYLRKHKGYNLELSYRHSHAVEIMRRILAQTDPEPPDICLLGIGPAASLLGSPYNEYNPLLFMPSLPQCVLAPKGSSKKKATIDSGQYLLMRDDPSTASFYFDDLQRRGVIPQHRVSVVQSEPDQVFRALQEGDEDARAILFFPYHLINKAFNRCEILDDDYHEMRDREVVLFAHERLLGRSGKARALNIAIRDAWLTLLGDPTLCKQLCDDLLDDQCYSTYLQRCSGAYQLTEQISP